jgi:hypothetical protein
MQNYVYIFKIILGMPRVLPRIVKIKTKNLLPQTGIKLSFINSDVYKTEQISKHNIKIACQMLRAGQHAIVHSTDSENIILRCDDLNNVTLNVLDHLQNQIYSAKIDKAGIREHNESTNAIHVENMLFLNYVSKQLCPILTQIQAASNSIQNGFVAGSNNYLGSDLCPLSDTFLLTNASPLSFAHDLLGKWPNEMGKNYTFTHGATALQLACLFAVGAKQKKNCIFNVNQLTSFKPSQALLDAVAETPAAFEMSMLSKCEDGNAKRFNVYVKSAACDSDIGRLAQQQCTSLNAEIQSPILIVNGIYDGIAAFIFHDQNNRPLAHLNACTSPFFFV